MARQSHSAPRSCVSPSNTASTTFKSRASTDSASPRSAPTSMRWRCSESARARRGWSATTSNGKSSPHSALASARSGTTVTASACRPTPQSVPTALSAACRNCCLSRASWRASNAALLLLVSGAAGNGQTSPGGAYDRTAEVQAICSQYAAAQQALPYDTMYAQCLYARGYRVPGFSPSPNSPGYQGELPGPAAHNGGP